MTLKNPNKAKKRAVKTGPKPKGPAGKEAVSKPKPAKATGRKSAMLKPATIEKLFQRFHDIEPEPQGELEHVNPYTLLVAVVLSAQATDKGVNIATRPLFKIADTPQKMVALGEDRVRNLIKTIGLYRNKAKNVIALSQRLVDEFDGEVPQNREDLESLPGVGRKTANVVLNVAFGQPTMAVDTHVFRLAHRLGLSKGKDPLAVEKDLVRKIPAAFSRHAHHWLILHGRYLCKARKPECWRCPVAEYCPFPDKTPAP